MKVDDEENCESHVFEGNVVLRTDLGLQGQPRQEWKLAADAAVKLSTRSQKIEHLAAQPGMFINSWRSTSDIAVGENPSLTLPKDNQLVLRLDAARGLQLDEKQRVVRWGDLCVDENSAEDDAWQVESERRPLWKKNALGGRPAIRFDGSTFLVTTPFSLGADVTILSVLQGRTHHLPKRRFGQVLDLNTNPSLILETTRDNHLAAILSSRTLNTRQPRRVLLEVSLPTREAPVVCALTYSHASNRSELYVNAQRVAESQAAAVPVIRTPKYIGRAGRGDAGFVGDVGEILVFNSALSPQQCHDISTDLMTEYGIPRQDREPRVLSGLIPDGEKE